ncbi:helix-turn-helix domain-containing protein [Prescottella equi]|uniref:helix-turn-helix domain-containing protein n=1 Tax=Rhodococcus hoagii TaxID=43767 RepID=UPI001E4D889F|nr:helix-turn-helix domain-containing protein [Prescottella equi]
MQNETFRPALTAADVAERLSMHPNSVYQLFKRKTHPIPHLRTGKAGIRVRAEAFDQWLREEEQMSVSDGRGRWNSVDGASD